MSETNIPARRIDDLLEAEELTGAERLVLEQGAGSGARTRRKTLDEVAAFVFASGSADMLRYMAGGDDAVEQSVADRLNRLVLATDYGATGDGETDDTEALKAFIVAATGRWGHIPAGVYRVTDLLDVPPGTLITGEGCDVWDLPSSGKPFSMSRGTTLLMCGTPATRVAVWGCTDMALAGGVVANPDAAGVGDANYALLNYMAADASGSTPATSKPLRVAVAVRDASNTSIRNLRIQLNFNGVDGYNDAATTGLGDNYDIGLLTLNSSFVVYEDLQVVGYWRMAGHASIHAKPNGEGLGEATYNRARRCYFQGFKGLSVRAVDVFRVTGFTSTTIEVPWTTSNILPASGTVLVNGRTYAYSSTTQAGDKLTLNGVSPDPTPFLALGQELRTANPNYGLAGSAYHDCIISGLAHTSRADPWVLGLPGPGAAYEVSGNPMRDLDFYNCHFFDGDVVGHLHDCQDIGHVSCYWEAYGRRATVGGAFGARAARFIVSPVITQSLAQYPAGECSFVVVDRTSEANGVDFHPVFRDAGITRFTNAAGLCMPRLYEMLPRGLTTQPFPAKAWNVATTIMSTGVAGSEAIRAVTPAFAEFMRLTPTAFVFGDPALTAAILTLQRSGVTVSWYPRSGGVGVFRVNGTDALIYTTSYVGPNADQGSSLGTAALRFLNGFMANLRLGSGTTIETSGTGSPEGVVTGPVGSRYWQENGAAGSRLWWKASGSGNTGWTAIL